MGGSGGGLVTPSFTKLVLEIERRIGKGMYEEILSVSHVTIMIAIASGNIYAGYIITTLGFSLTFIIFGLAGLVVLAACAYLTRSLMNIDESVPTDEVDQAEK